MSEDQVLILAPKALVTKLFEGATSAGGGGGGGGGGEGVGFFNNDISLELSKGAGEGTTRTQGEVRKLVNHVETWKTHDDVNFVKSADVTHFIDFGGVARERGDFLRQNELLRCKGDIEAEEQTNNSNGQRVDSAAEEAVMHTLTHGMAKCTTTVAFFEEFEDVSDM